MEERRSPEHTAKGRLGSVVLGRWGAGLRGFIRVSGERGSPREQRWSLLPSGRAGMLQSPLRLLTVSARYVSRSVGCFTLVAPCLTKSQKKHKGTAICRLLWFSL